MDRPRWSIVTDAAHSAGMTVVSLIVLGGLAERAVEMPMGATPRLVGRRGWVEPGPAPNSHSARILLARSFVGLLTSSIASASALAGCLARHFDRWQHLKDFGSFWADREN